MLIEDSPHPLSSPVWSPDGRRLFYCRLVQMPGVTAPGQVRGRCELVVQQAVDSRRIVLTLPEAELDRQQLADFLEQKAAWSPDGQFLAVPRPGPSPAVLIVLPDQGRTLTTITGTRCPAWSPDGARLAVIKEPVDDVSAPTIQVFGHDFKAGRTLIELGELTETPVWSLDGLSLLAAGRRAQSRSREIELLRVLIDSGAAGRLLALGTVPPEHVLRNVQLRKSLEEPGESASCRIAFAIDRDQEQCVFSAELPSQPAAIGFGSISQPMILKRLHPLDLSMRLGTLSLHPESNLVAVRIEAQPGVALPLLLDLNTEAVRLIAPDLATHRQWLSALVRTAREDLAKALPPPMVDGRRIDRGSILPVSGEIPAQSPMILRLRRLGRIGRVLVDQPQGHPSTTSLDDGIGEAPDEYRLFFDYLKGDLAAAAADLEQLEARDLPLQVRLRLLGLRAQILHAQGQADRSRSIVDYLLKTQGAGPRLIEDTPSGVVIAPPTEQAALWNRYLAGRFAASAQRADDVGRGRWSHRSRKRPAPGQSPGRP